MLLSIIIPVYKSEKTIVECLNSVIKEAPAESEIILVDDGSPDNCPELCDEYAAKDSRIRVIHKQNGGLSSARNAGLEVATGEYVFFLDSDDYIEKNYFNLMLEKKADLVISSFCAFYQNGLPDYTLNLEGKSYGSLKDYLLDFHNYFPVTFNTAWGKLYRKDIIEKEKLRFREDLFMVEDILFNLLYYPCCKKIYYQSQAVVKYRQTNGTLSRKTNDKLFNWYEESYTNLKALLESELAFSENNENKFYTSVYGNTLECLISAAHTSLSSVKELSKTICNSELAVKASKYNQSKKTAFIATAVKKRNKVLVTITVYAYVFALNVKAFWRKLR